MRMIWKMLMRLNLFSSLIMDVHLEFLGESEVKYDDFMLGERVWPFLYE